MPGELNEQQIEKLNNQLASELNYITNKSDSITHLKQNANATDI